MIIFYYIFFKQSHGSPNLACRVWKNTRYILQNVFISPTNCTEDLSVRRGTVKEHSRFLSFFDSDLTLPQKYNLLFPKTTYCIPLVLIPLILINRRDQMYV